MKVKKIHFLSLLAILGSTMYWTKDQGPVESTLSHMETRAPVRNISSLPKKQLDRTQIDLSRTPQSEAIGRPKNRIENLVLAKTQRTRTNPPEVISLDYRGLDSLKIAATLRSVKETDFSPEMGERLKETQGMTIFRPAPGRQDESWSHVAYDDANDRFFPISSVLKVQKVDPALRDELLHRGYHEYYYAPPTQLLFVSSTHEKLFEDYRRLEAQGLEVSLEVLRGRHHSR